MPAAPATIGRGQTPEGGAQINLVSDEEVDISSNSSRLVAVSSTSSFELDRKKRKLGRERAIQQAKVKRAMAEAQANANMAEARAQATMAEAQVQAEKLQAEAEMARLKLKQTFSEQNWRQKRRSCKGRLTLSRPKVPPGLGEGRVDRLHLR